MVTFIWPCSLFSTSLLCSVTSLAMSEEHPKVTGWLLAMGCSLRSQSLLLCHGNPQLTSAGRLRLLSGSCGCCSLSAPCFLGAWCWPFSTSCCEDLGHGRSMARSGSEHPLIRFHFISFRRGLWSRRERLFLNLLIMLFFPSLIWVQISLTSCLRLTIMPRKLLFPSNSSCQQL